MAKLVEQKVPVMEDDGESEAELDEEAEYEEA
jgi:hypothetical protein